MDFGIHLTVHRDHVYLNDIKLRDPSFPASSSYSSLPKDSHCLSVTIQAMESWSE